MMALTQIPGPLSRIQLDVEHVPTGLVPDISDDLPPTTLSPILTSATASISQDRAMNSGCLTFSAHVIRGPSLG
jgi:hypothetical protein